MATSHYPLELGYIKRLFLAAQYRQCIQACRDLTTLYGAALDARPLHVTAINLYLGLCHDELARVMHQNSVAKMPAFTSAEQFYLNALQALPSTHDAHLLCLGRSTPDNDDPFVDKETASEYTQSPAFDGTHSLHFTSRASSPTPPSSSPVQNEDLSFFSPLKNPSTVVSNTGHDDDDESYDTFPGLMAPNRMLQRDFSSMSLLDDATTPRPLRQAVSRISLLEPTPRKANATSVGLLRPIRLGSPPRQYHVPPRLPYTGASAHLKSKLPQAAGRARTEPQPETTARNTRVDFPKTTSPVSPVESDFDISDTSTISAISPQTPRLAPRTTTASSDEDFHREAVLLRFTNHIASMRLQLQRHLMAVQESKQRLLQAQAEKRAARKAQAISISLSAMKTEKPKIITSTPNKPGTKKPQGSRIQQAKSYWSFVPQDVKAAEKQARVVAGRERKWARKRFDPGKYQLLCEQALAEL